MLERWKKLSSEDRFKNPWWTYRLDRFALPNGKEGEYHFVHTGGSVVIVPVREDGRILMNRQYRYVLDAESVEFPGGGMRDGEDAETIAHKELVEEGGVDGTLAKIGAFAPYNGIADEICHVFLARDVRPSTEHAPDETEEFEHAWKTPEEVDALIAEGGVSDAMTIAAWTLAKPRLNG
jgi:ADP-ribose pyrophosphatase